MNKVKLRLFSIIDWGDIDKTDEIVAVNDRSEKNCLCKALLSLDNRNIDASCLNRNRLP